MKVELKPPISNVTSFKDMKTGQVGRIVLDQRTPSRQYLDEIVVKAPNAVFSLSNPERYWTCADLVPLYVDVFPAGTEIKLMTEV